MRKLDKREKEGKKERLSKKGRWLRKTDERDKHEGGVQRERQEEEKRDGKEALERDAQENSPEGVFKEISLLKMKHQQFQMMKLNTVLH